MLIGMVLTFAGVATLAALGGDWAVQANVAGRYAAIAVLAGFGVTLLSTRAAALFTRPAVALGSRLSQKWPVSRRASERRSFSVLQPDFFGRPARAQFWAWC